MYIRAKVELIADKDAKALTAQDGELVLQYPVPAWWARSLGRWLTERTNAIEGPEPVESES
jgi:hypothetical protein